MLRDTQLSQMASILQEKYGSANTARNSLSNSMNVLYVVDSSSVPVHVWAMGRRARPPKLLKDIAIAETLITNFQ